MSTLKCTVHHLRPRPKPKAPVHKQTKKSARFTKAQINYFADILIATFDIALDAPESAEETTREPREEATAASRPTAAATAAATESAGR